MPEPDHTPAASDSAEPLNPLIVPPAAAVLPSPAIEYLVPPRIGIIHLLAWVTCTAILLKFNTGMEMLSAPPSNAVTLPQPFFYQGIHAARCILNGALLVGASVLFHALWRREKGRFQPGHWILAINGVSILLWCLLNFAAVLILAGDLRMLGSFGMYLNIVSLSFHAIATAWAAWKLPEHGRWTIYLGMSSLNAAYHAWGYPISFIPFLRSPGFLHLLIFLRIYCEPLLGLSCLAAVILDSVRGPSRDWLHWLAVAFAFSSLFLWAAGAFGIKLLESYRLM